LDISTSFLLCPASAYLGEERNETVANRLNQVAKRLSADWSRPAARDPLLAVHGRFVQMQQCELHHRFDGATAERELVVDVLLCRTVWVSPSRGFAGFQPKKRDGRFTIPNTPIQPTAAAQPSCIADVGAALQLSRFQATDFDLDDVPDPLDDCPITSCGQPTRSSFAKGS
jgi:hypothetical protein